MSEDPTPRQILLEVAIYALLFLLVGGFFVALRVSREGARVLNYDVRDPK